MNIVWQSLVSLLTNQLFIGAALGWFLQRLTDIYSKPRLTFEIGSDPIFLPETSAQVKFLNVKIKNVKRNLLSNLLLGNHSASNARSWVSFADPVTKAELLKINGRWTTTKEPVDYKGGINIGDALITSRETLPPGEESEIGIAIKEDGKNEAYGFNNESYLFSWKKPDFELSEKRYILKVKVAAEGKEWSEEFVLVNLGKTLRNFKLVESI